MSGKRSSKAQKRGGAWIYTHSSLNSAIVKNHLGCFYKGQSFENVRDAMKAALEEIQN